MNKNRNFLKQIKEIVFRLTNNKKLNLKEINFSEDFDSLQMLDFVEELERCFEIKISPQDLNHKNFSNLKNLEKIIKEGEKYKRKLMNNKKIDSILYFGRKDCAYSNRLKSFLKNKTNKFYYVESAKERVKVSLKKYLKNDYSYIIFFRSFYIVKRDLIDKAKIAAINFHPGTSDFRGIGCVNYALYEKAKYYGSTCHLVTEEIDKGQILNEQKFRLKKGDTIQNVLKKTYKMMISQAKFILDHLFINENNLEKLIQENENAKWSNKIRKLNDLNKFYETKINCSRDELEKKIRATNTDTFKTYIILHNKKFVYSGKIKKLKDLNKFYETKINCSRDELEKKIRSTNTGAFKTYINLHDRKFIYSGE